MDKTLQQSDVDELIKQFNESKLTSAQLSEKLSNATISQITIRYITSCDLHIQNTRFVICNFNYLDLSSCNFTNVVFDYASFNFCNCSCASFVDCKFTNVGLFVSDFSCTRFYNCHNADTTNDTLIVAKQSLLTGVAQTNCDEKLFYVKQSIISKNFSSNKFQYGSVLTQPLIGYKKAKISDRYVLIKLEIPEGAIVFQPNNYKCRTNIVKVLRIYDMTDDKEYNIAYSMYNHRFAYTVGETIKCHDFELNNTIECAEGIHFFMTEKEAKLYVY
mgnify:CR=1 FL=1